MFSQIKRESKIMIILDMQLLKMVEVEEEDLEILIFQALSQIFLKISSVISEVEEEVENQVLEVQI